MRTPAIWIEDKAPDAEAIDIQVTNEFPDSVDGQIVAVVEGVACGPKDMPGKIICKEISAYRALFAAGFNVKCRSL